MAPLRRLASVALSVACCVVSAVSAQDDTPAPVLISGLDNGAPSTPAPVLFSDNNNDPNAPVFLPGVVLDNNDNGAAAPVTENVLLANGTSPANSSDSDAPVFLPGVYLDGSGAGGSAAPAAGENVLLADGNNSTEPSGGSDVVLGGWPSMPVGDAEIAFLVSALSDAKLYNPSLSFGVCMKDIFGLQYQSVSGTNFRFSGHGCLVQKGSNLMGACTFDCAIEKLQVTIFTQEWTNTVEVNNIAYIE